MDTATAATRISFRALTVGLILAFAYTVGLSIHKEKLLEHFAQSRLPDVQKQHPFVLGQFQANHYFYFQDRFLPNIRETLTQVQDLSQVQILSEGGNLLFNSARAEQIKTPTPFDRKEIVAHLKEAGPGIFTAGFQAHILIPSGQYGVLYTLSAASIRDRLAALWLMGLLLEAVLFWLFYQRSMVNFFKRVNFKRRLWGHTWGLRSKFLLAIIVINLMTGAIVFFTLSALQTREQTERIQKEAILFGQFSTAQVISDFSNYFHFYYADKFLPGIKGVIASNENLLGVRIISRRTKTVVFDSGSVADSVGVTSTKIISQDLESDFKNRDVVTQERTQNGKRLLAVTTAYRNENQEALFYVEYLFSYESLIRNIQNIRRQILIDLLPSMALGFLIAILFAQFLILPIRRLMAAVQRVASGDYDVSVDLKRADEIGELVTAFNSMTSELKKKKELRKYLSDATYRKVMETPEDTDQSRLRGTKVIATVLFADIRNFVSHCETLEAEEVTDMLNEYFTEMVEVIYKNGGEVDKFIGDALLAVFYDEGKSLQTIHCALEMRERLREFNERRAAANKSKIEIGVGIAHGEIISGPIGSKDRRDFTVIGDVVNLASRIEKLSKQGRYTKIVFSGEVEEKIRGLLDYEMLSESVIRGKEEAVLVYELKRVLDLQVLIDNLTRGDRTLKLRSIELLGLSRNETAVSNMLELLQDKDEEIRLSAVVALGRLVLVGDSRVIDAVSMRLKQELSNKVASALISLMGKVCKDDRILELASFLETPNERVVANTIEAMGQGRSPRCTDLILPFLASRNNRIKANAAMALFSAGHLEVIDMLKPMLMHSDPLMRASSAFAIGELTLITQQERLVEAWKTNVSGVRRFLAEIQECVPMLVLLLKDKEPMVKRQAVIALGKIKDKSAVLPIIDNLHPESDSKDFIRDVSQALRAIGSHQLVRDVISKLT